MMQAAVNLGKINVHGQEAVLPNAIDLLSTPSPGPGEKTCILFLFLILRFFLKIYFLSLKRF